MKKTTKTAAKKPAQRKVQDATQLRAAAAMTNREKAAFIAGLIFIHSQRVANENGHVCDDYCLLYRHAVKALRLPQLQELVVPMLKNVQAQLRANGFPFDEIPAEIRN
jgi:hypothetical protein